MFETFVDYFVYNPLMRDCLRGLQGIVSDTMLMLSNVMLSDLFLHSTRAFALKGTDRNTFHS